jgi:carboxylesterase type B
VTIGGQSAGGANVHSLMASPLAKGLFRAAIIESAGGGSRPLAEVEQAGVKFAEAKGARSLEELRKMSWKELTAAPTTRFSTAAVDGYVLPGPLVESDVPVLTGTNKHESGATPHPDVTPAAYQEQVRRRYQDLADEVLALYPVAAPNDIAWDSVRVSNYRKAAEKKKVYTYFWDHAMPGPDADQYGAFHSSEVPYAMGALSMAERPFTAADHKIADMMSSYWANFIANGDPNGTGLPHWPAVNEKSGYTMEVGDTTAAIPVAGSEAKRKLLDKFFARQ